MHCRVIWDGCLCERERVEMSLNAIMKQDGVIFNRLLFIIYEAFVLFTGKCNKGRRGKEVEEMWF